MRKEKYLESERRYRQREDVKLYQKQYQKLYRQLCKGLISMEEFGKLKPVK